MQPKVILASGSPRRRELLGQLIQDFEILASGAEESDVAQPERDFGVLDLPAPYNVPAESNPILWGWRKAVGVALVEGAEAERDTIILGADTIVVLDERILGKPRDVGDAFDMLRNLAGREHVVVTGWALILVPHGSANAEPTLLRHGYASTVVRMRPYDQALVEWYVNTGEPMDKAGAYGAQGHGSRLITGVQGCWNNVIGLPVCAIRAALMGLGLTVSSGEEWRSPCAGPYCTPSS